MVISCEILSKITSIIAGDVCRALLHPSWVPNRPGFTSFGSLAGCSDLRYYHVHLERRDNFAGTQASLDLAQNTWLSWKVEI